MGENNRNLTDAEWNVMECLWQKSPRTGRETIDWLKERMGWSRSTTLTLLRRMEEKGAVGSEASGEVKKFFPGKVFKTVVPRGVRLSEAPSFGMPVIYFDKSSKGSHAYLDLANEIIRKER